MCAGSVKTAGYKLQIVWWLLLVQTERWKYFLVMGLKEDEGKDLLFNLSHLRKVYMLLWGNSTGIPKILLLAVVLAPLPFCPIIITTTTSYLPFLSVSFVDILSLSSLSLNLSFLRKWESFCMLFPSPLYGKPISL